MKFACRSILKDVPKGTTVKLTPQGKFYIVGENFGNEVELICGNKIKHSGKYASVYVCRSTPLALDGTIRSRNDDYNRSNF